MESLGNTYTDPLLIGSQTAVRHAKVGELWQCCESQGLIVGSSGQRKQAIRNDYVMAILAYFNDKRQHIGQDVSNTITTEPRKNIKRARLILPNRPRKRQKKGQNEASKEYMTIPFINLTPEIMEHQLVNGTTGQNLKRSGHGQYDESRKRQKIVEDKNGSEHMDNATMLITTEHLDTLSLQDQSPETDDDSVQSYTSDHIADLIPALETMAAEERDTSAARPSEHKKIVRVRLFKNANDWRYINQVDVPCGSNGDLDLCQVGLHLNITGDCRVIDPVNGRPFFLYNGYTIDALEVQQLMEQEGYLRIVKYQA